jgi:hypothetical protein
MTPLINGESYSWGSIACNILRNLVSGITSINYSEDQDMEDFYGAGNYPVSRGYGKIKATGDVTLMMEEVEALQKAAPGGRLQAIPAFDIIVSFLRLNDIVVTHKLKNCQFKKNERAMKTGDMGFEVKLDLIVSHIEWNA